MDVAVVDTDPLGDLLGEPAASGEDHTDLVEGGVADQRGDAGQIAATAVRVLDDQYRGLAHDEVVEILWSRPDRRRQDHAAREVRGDVQRHPRLADADVPVDDHHGSAPAGGPGHQQGSELGELHRPAHQWGIRPREREGSPVLGRSEHHVGRGRGWSQVASGQCGDVGDESPDELVEIGPPIPVADAHVMDVR